jgi:hypothetical protein
MPIATLGQVKIDESIGFLDGIPVAIRSNCASSGGGWFPDKDNKLFPGELKTVILGVQPCVGMVPARSTVKSLTSLFANSERFGKEAETMSIEEKIINLPHFIIPWVAVHHIPLPASLDKISNPAYKGFWPKGKVTQTFFKSFGLTADKGLLGPGNLLSRIELSGLSWVDVITIIDFKQTGTNKSYINTFDYLCPQDKDSPEAKHVNACKKFLQAWVKDHPDAQELPSVSMDALMPVEIEDIFSMTPNRVAKSLHIAKMTAAALLPIEKAKGLPWAHIEKTIQEFDQDRDLLLLESTTIDVEAIE